MTTIELPAWAQPFAQPARYKVAYGGRAGSKTWTFAGLLLLDGYQQPLRVACMREFQNSIEESAKTTLELLIDRYGLGAFYTIQRHYIYGANGTVFLFRGMNNVTNRNVKGLEDVDRCWFEEAETMTQTSLELLRPTIRKPGSELWFSFNPRNRSDAVWQRFIVTPPDNAVVRKVTYADNAWLSPEADEDRLLCLRDEPDRYPHIWLGEPDDTGGMRQVLPFSLVSACVRPPPIDVTGRAHIGLDVGDGGDFNAVVVRRGPVVTHVESWASTPAELGKTTRRAHAVAVEHAVQRMFYDVGGPRAGVRSHLREMLTDHDVAYYPEGVNFGGEVGGKDREYSYRVRNADHFRRRNMQMAWALRLRALRTQRLNDGEAVDPETCLFIDPNLPNVDRFLTQLSQPVYEEDAAGRLVLDKAPDDAPSPDQFDAACLAFAWDSRDGLRVG